MWTGCHRLSQWRQHQDWELQKVVWAHSNHRHSSTRSMDAPTDRHVVPECTVLSLLRTQQCFGLKESLVRHLERTAFERRWFDWRVCRRRVPVSSTPTTPRLCGRRETRHFLRRIQTRSPAAWFPLTADGWSGSSRHSEIRSEQCSQSALQVPTGIMNVQQTSCKAAVCLGRSWDTCNFEVRCSKRHTHVSFLRPGESFLLIVTLRAPRCPRADLKQLHENHRCSFPSRRTGTSVTIWSTVRSLHRPKWSPKRLGGDHNHGMIAGEVRLDRLANWQRLYNEQQLSKELPVQLAAPSSFQ
jgi:hypothetical protein